MVTRQRKTDHVNVVNVPEQPSKDLWTCKIIKRGQSIFTRCWSKECLFVRHINRENAPATFSSILQAESLQNGSELHSKQLRFWTHKSWKFVQKFLCKPWRWRTSKTRLNFTANSFIFGRTNRGIAPRTSVKLAGRELPKCVWISGKTASFLDAQIVELRPQLFL